MRGSVNSNLLVQHSGYNSSSYLEIMTFYQTVRASPPRTTEDENQISLNIKINVIVQFVRQSLFEHPYVERNIGA